LVSGTSLALDKRLIIVDCRGKEGEAEFRREHVQLMLGWEAEAEKGTSCT